MLTTVRTKLKTDKEPLKKKEQFLMILLFFGSFYEVVVCNDGSL